jgi:hypothetical protein
MFLPPFETALHAVVEFNDELLEVHYVVRHGEGSKIGVAGMCCVEGPHR